MKIIISLLFICISINAQAYCSKKDSTTGEYKYYLCSSDFLPSQDNSWLMRLDDEEGYFTGYSFNKAGKSRFVAVDGFCLHGGEAIFTEKTIRIEAECPYKKIKGLYSIEFFEDGSNTMTFVSDVK